MYHPKTLLLLFVFTSILFYACKTEEEPDTMSTDNFDRKEMLEDWADLIIIPAFESYLLSLQTLQDKKEVFLSAPDQNHFDNLRTSYLNAYRSWQKVAMFDIGKAEEIGLRNYTNIFPTDKDAIDDNISTQNYNLVLPSNFDAQGFPALDYLLYGIAVDDATILNLLKQPNYSQYLDDVVSRLFTLADQVLEDWKNGYRINFINNDGSSGTASVDKLVNDFLFYYEKYVRAGKIGIPAGVFSGNTLPQSVEAPYSDVYSKELFFVAFTAVQDFFAGKSFDGTTQGKSLEAYLLYVMEQNETSDLSTEIKNQWTMATDMANALSDSFQSQVDNDNNKMLMTYDELQKAVVILKVDMMQALNIQVDYVDADGD